MKTYLMILIGALSLALAEEMLEKAVSYDAAEQNYLARKAGGPKYRLPYMLKKLQKQREREAKSQTV